MPARRLLIGAAFAGIAAVFACTEGTAPVAPKSSSADALSALPRTSPTNNGHRVRAVRWSNGLSRDVLAWKKIGPKGGVVRLPRLHVNFIVPPGALTQRTRITVRALAGNNVVFVMEPEGLVFAQPATLSMDLSYTTAYHNNSWHNNLVGAFIPSPQSIAPDDSVTDYEDHPATTDDAMTTAYFPVPHFSVVILASQRSGTNGGGLQ